jgi:hypothetical protein
MHKRLLLTIGTLAFVFTSTVVGMQTPPTGTIRGTVTRGGTSQGLPDIQVILVDPRNGRGALRGQNVPPPQNADPTTKTDRDGRFVFEKVEPGTYTVRIQQEGYFVEEQVGRNPLNLFTRPVIVMAGQPIPDIAVSMVPGAAVSGRVVDVQGRPVVGMTVQAFQMGYENGLPSLVSGVTSATDDRGEFRLYRMPPGEFYLAASPLPGARGAAPPREGLVQTFYPDVLDAKAARMVRLAGGDDLTGMTITMRSSPMFTIFGQIVSSVPPQARITARGNVAVAPNLTLVPRDKNIATERNLRSAATVAADGTFQIQGVTPGSYDLYATLNNATFDAAAAAAGAPNAYFGRTAVDVGSQNVQGVTVAIVPGVELKAYATVDGSAAAASGIVRLVLQSDDSARRIPTYARGSQVLAGADGSFTIPHVNEGLYRVQVNPMVAPQGRGRGQRGGVYVEDIREGGTSVHDNGLRIGKEAPRPVEIIIKTNSGSIEGAAYNSQQQPRSGATVALVPQASRRQNPGLYRLATSDPMGRFTLSGVPPGQYKLFAWESIPSGAYQNPEFIAKYEERGTAVTVNPATTTSAQVTVTPADR